MFSTEIIITVVLVAALIVAIDRAGRFLQRVSPSTLRYADYGAFAVAAVTGALLYFGRGNTAVRYIFFLSMIVYFVVLRYTAHGTPSVQD